MKNGKPGLVVTNPRFETEPERAAVWVSDLLCRLRPGGTWVVPRSVSTVLVLSEDPPIVMAHTIFPDQSLLDLLRKAGWAVQRKQSAVR